MKNRNMKVRGVIKTVRSITVDGEECHGLYEGEGDNFVIRVNAKIMRDSPIYFLKVLLHEILHLYMFIVDNYTHGQLRLTENIQHNLMGKLVKELTDRIALRAVKITNRGYHD